MSNLLTMQAEACEMYNTIHVNYELAFIDLEKTEKALELLSMPGVDSMDKDLLESIYTGLLGHSGELLGFGTLASGGVLGGLKKLGSSIWDAIVGFFKKIGEWLGLVKKKSKATANKDCLEIGDSIIEALKGDEEKSKKAKEDLEKIREAADKSVKEQYDLLSKMAGNLSSGVTLPKKLKENYQAAPKLSMLTKVKHLEDAAKGPEEFLKAIKGKPKLLGEAMKEALEYKKMSDEDLASSSGIESVTKNFNDAKDLAEKLTGKEFKIGSIIYRVSGNPSKSEGFANNIISRIEDTKMREGNGELETISIAKRAALVDQITNSVNEASEYYKSYDKYVSLLSKQKDDFAEAQAKLKKLTTPPAGHSFLLKDGPKFMQREVSVMSKMVKDLLDLLTHSLAAPVEI